ncbi:MAG TPA: hypothetical protein VGQ36_08020 [Thermoanaerobaculia bacterium]|jgi:hypothetical protein|nr:hypothetical protein [Thermoanaerobaculia bacterium]
MFLVPLIFVALFLRGRPANIYVSDDPFWIGNYSPSALPNFAAEIVSYNYYLATAAALLLAFGCAVVLRRARRRCAVESRLVWYLPAFVAGIEAVRHAWLLGSRHSFTVAPTPPDMREEWFAASLASVFVVVLCVVLGRLFSGVARENGRIPWTVAAVVLCAIAAWCAQLSVVWLVV